MLDYLRAEGYKVSRRPYLWITLLVVAGLELLLVLMWAWFNGDMIHMTVADGLLMLLYLLTMGYYAAGITTDMVFSDQYKHNTLKNEVAAGIPRYRIYLGKLLAGSGLSIVACVVLPGWYALLCALMLPGSGELTEALETVGFALLCALPVWLGAQSLYTMCLFTIRGSVAATLVSVGIVALLGQVFTFLSLLLALQAPGLADLLFKLRDFLLTSPLENIMDAIGDWSRVAWAWAVGAGWCFGTTVLGLWQFGRKEIN